MRIVHLCLSNFFIDDQGYQENLLTMENAKAGHDVTVIASRHINKLDGNYGFADVCDTVNKHNVRVIRLRYHPIIPKQLGIRLRIHTGLFDLLEQLRPDVMVFHGISGWELFTVTKYIKKYPECTLYADNHADFFTAGRTWITRIFLHKIYYGWIIRHTYRYIKKILCVSPLTLKYAHEFYGIPAEKLELFPLGAQIHELDEIQKRSRDFRSNLGIAQDNIVFVQSGKQYARKYLLETLRAFSSVGDFRFRFIIAGVLMDDVKRDALELIEKDERIIFLGWQSEDELSNLLCAADVYLVPGRQTATTQASMGSCCALVLEDHIAHHMYVERNGWLVNNEDDIKSVFSDVSKNTNKLEEMKRLSYNFARANLDYGVLAQRYL
jgi:1,2-diacylglycerol 3-alpha-glucosyltransferase